ncbi:predicted protein [Naegleria gruberi]|uniref:Predicted protein n=1 Tax=Naegleria gruberi TaxID=5762 RepID=D2VFA6_NAEGR|nr:uncharacterized protein NAEGRDRAFT_33688 [Naegleria gruberi]EFC44425.1 predicted protein [Naegleria gruberi]|eukprot:XP_002677169.1 predicted protein [Naegleria gruberi strain NEG-M]
MGSDEWDKELIESEKRLKDSLEGKYQEFDETKTLIYQTHKRSATKFLNLFIDLGGIFIKVGQYMSSMTNFLPDAWTETLQVLQDKVPYQADLSEIRLMFEEEFHKHPELKDRKLEDIFESFDELPIAAASLAQVHKAKLRKGAIESLKGTELDGSTVAVKIQYPSIRYFYKGDMIAKQAAMEIIHFFFPHYNISWMGKMLDDTLNQELDFHIEHENSNKIRKLFEKEEEGITQSLYIPKIVSPLSSKRVLTMEFIDGWKISDIESITKHMDHKRMVESAKTTMSIFAKMIFVFGFVHTDPHPGNILVRAHPKNPNHSQVVLLDHGLYQTLDPDFRVKFARFWRALVMHDKPVVDQYCKDLGIDDSQLYASLILMRGYDEKSGIGLSSHGTKAEFETFFKGIIKHRMDKFQQMVRNMPTEMLLIMRTNNLLRYVNQSMGVPVNRYVINARIASRGMYHSKSLPDTLSACQEGKPLSENLSMWNYMKLKYQQHSQYLHFETILFIYEYKQWLWNVWYRLMIHYGFMEPIRIQVDKNDMDVVLAA